MDQAELVKQLDALFQAEKFNESQTWDFAMPESYRSVLQRYATPRFPDGTWNGLILDNTPQFSRVAHVQNK